MSFTTLLFTTVLVGDTRLVLYPRSALKFGGGACYIPRPHSGNVNNHMNHNGGEQPVCIAEAGESVLLGRSDYRISFLPTEQVRGHLPCLLVSRSQIL